MNPKIPLLFAATLSASTLATRAHAQLDLAPPTPTAPQKTTAASQWQFIQVRNVPANLMAHWFDPKHNTVFAAFEDVKPTWAAGRTAPEIQEMLSLPKGVSLVVSVEEQNAMWVHGTETGIQLLKEKIALLDTPLRQVEVEAQCIRISDADIKTLGIDFAKGEGAVETGTAGANIKEQIAALIAQNRARVITAPRVIAIFGQTAMLSSTTDTPILLIPKDETGHLMQQLKQAGLPQEEQLLMFVSTSIGLTVTPTLNTDNTIAVQMGPLRTIGLGSSKPNGEVYKMTDSDRIVLKDPDAIPIKPFILKDKQTAALRGLTWRLGENGFPNDLNAKTQTMSVLVLVTPRIVRRVGDDVVAALPR